LNIKSPKFAFLSACHTSAMRDVRLLDESITLSSAVQLSGYPSVVGSLWEVIDEHSTHVAKVVYEYILSEGVVNAERAAEGLRKVVSDLRDRTRIRERHDPLIWAPYIHVGI
jgi:CHAT domain-containing protein